MITIAEIEKARELRDEDYHTRKQREYIAFETLAARIKYAAHNARPEDGAWAFSFIEEAADIVMRKGGQCAVLLHQCIVSLWFAVKLKADGRTLGCASDAARFARAAFKAPCAQQENNEAERHLEAEVSATERMARRAVSVRLLEILEADPRLENATDALRASLLDFAAELRSGS